MMVSFKIGDKLEKDRMPEWLRSFLFRSFYYDSGTDRTGLNVYKKATVLRTDFYSVFDQLPNCVKTVRDVSFELNGHSIIISYP